MDCHRPKFAWSLVLYCILSFIPQRSTNADDTTPAAGSPSAEMSQPTPLTRAFRNDAALNDIAFVDQRFGWAVGDRGAIWHSDDAGTTWRQQQSPASCTLNSICMLDARRGWAVGGQNQPCSKATRGVVLRTDDGGDHWRPMPQPLIPLLVGVKFFDANHGIAFGQSAPYSPSGVFSTHDGGNTWQSLPADDSGSWLAGDFLEPDAGALAGPAGKIATLLRQKVVASPLAAASLRSVRAMRLAAPASGWAVGDGSLVLTTSDLGHSWQTPPQSPLQRTGVSSSDSFDFQAVAIHGSHIWIAGTPGTRIFHSPDGGNTWQANPTGQTAPIHSIRFIDSKHGWAAGALGNILATQDGGQSWQIQRSGARRAALLAIFANPTDVPLELLADSGAANGYIAAVDILCTPQSTGEVTSATLERTKESMLLSGAAAANSAWRFPVPPADLALAPDDLLQALNGENDGRALHQLENRLVRDLRMWCPDVVVIPSSGVPPQEAARPQSNLTSLIERLAAKAIEAAADSNQHPDIASEVGLPPWQVKKVYGLVAPGAHGEETIDSAHFSPWLGTTLAGFASPARNLLFDKHTPPPDSYSLKLLATRIPPTAARGVFSGITLSHGSDARRLQPDLPNQDLDELRRLANRRRILDALLERSQGNAAWTAQVTQMIDGLGDDDSGQLLVELAEGYRKAGRLDLAADSYFLFARRTPDHPLVDSALTWLVQFYASDEFARRLTASLPKAYHRIGEVASATGPNDAVPSSKIQQAAALNPTAHAITTPSNLTRDDRLRRAKQLVEYLKTARPALYAEPAVRFAEVAADRRLGFANPAARLFISLRQLPPSDPWRQCAATEEWLAKPANTPPPKKLAACRKITESPHLDGLLNEPFWEAADHLILRSTSTPSRSEDWQGEGSEVRFAHDNEFLYFAIRCAKSPNLNYQSDDSPRTRDADLTQHDRVIIRLDTDRDYTTSFDLTVDNRGWTHDACWGDASWNPTWYVAAAADEKSWTIEAAIPIGELADKPPASREAWSLAIRRIVPRAGYQTWSAAPTSGDSPSQFGILIFE
jgi:photosystem II stability/assembly factor-like uncharacterized protein